MGLFFMGLFFQSELRKLPILVALLPILLGLGACSDSSVGGQQTPPVLRNWAAGVFYNSINYRDQCANPRTGNDPFSGSQVFDRQGRMLDENDWLRSIHHEFYLWYDEIIDVDPGLYSTAAYFDLQKTNQQSVTGSNRPKDQFHFAVDSQQLFDSLVAGVEAGYGARFVVLSPTPPREVVVAYVEPGSPATAAGLARGARILTVDGVDVVNGTDPDALNTGLFPAASGESHDFLVRDLNSVVDRPITMTSAEIIATPVQNVGIIPTSNNVGYLLFNDHIATAETQLIDAINLLSGLGVTDLVLDLRYNGGGYLDIASELAYMIAGGTATTGKTFERLQFNDQYVNFDANPLTGGNLRKLFHSTVQGFSAGLTRGDPLPTLAAQNVIVLTTAETCSASEAIINGLRGAGVNVAQVGTRTCGKPYGTIPLGNCGTTYLFTQFEGFNELDQGGYSDGFKPANASGDGEIIPGCSVLDDFDNDFNDPLEANVAAALGYLQTQSCPTPPLVVPKISAVNKISGEGAQDGAIKNPKEIKMKIVF